MEYILRNNKYNAYLKYWKKIKYNHLVFVPWEASIFNLKEAKKRLESFKHKENWEIIEYDKDIERVC